VRLSGFASAPGWLHQSAESSHHARLPYEADDAQAAYTRFIPTAALTRVVIGASIKIRRTTEQNWQARYRKSIWEMPVDTDRNRTTSSLSSPDKKSGDLHE
jgi:hypothetical protein